MAGLEAQWVWVGIGLVLLVTEIAVSSLVALPLALGAFAAGAVALFGGGIELQFAAAAVVAVGSFAGLRPLARRLNQAGQVEGIGAHRLTNATAVALSAIDDTDGGMVRAGSEEWHATSGSGDTIAAGSRLRILGVEGSRLVVVPDDDHAPEGDQAEVQQSEAQDESPREGSS